MTSQNAAGATPANVAQIATQPDVLARRQLALIGLFGAEGAMGALLRDSGGRIRRVRPGDTVDGAQVLGIDAAGVIVHKRGRNQRLALPAG